MALEIGSRLGQVYVARFPTLEDRQAVSVGEAGVPVWSPDGRELFYLTLDGMMAVPITIGSTLTLGTPETVFEETYGSRPDQTRWHDLEPAGQRFLMIPEQVGDHESQVVLVQNWLEELKRLVPVD